MKAFKKLCLSVLYWFLPIRVHTEEDFVSLLKNKGKIVIDVSICSQTLTPSWNVSMFPQQCTHIFWIECVAELPDQRDIIWQINLPGTEFLTTEEVLRKKELGYHILHLRTLLPECTIHDTDNMVSALGSEYFIASLV